MRMVKLFHRGIPKHFSQDEFCCMPAHAAGSAGPFE